MRTPGVHHGRLFGCTRAAGFTPAQRADFLRKMKPLGVSKCPFCNLPEKRLGDGGEELN